VKPRILELKGRECSLFSAYTTTANGNMANVAYGILFGNEDIKNWTIFCNFMAREHPTINRPQVTILTNQDKRSINAIENCIPHAHNFHCAFHRRQNIITKCGGGSGKKPGTALWLYNKLSSCPNMAILRARQTGSWMSCTLLIYTTSPRLMKRNSILLLVVPWDQEFVCTESPHPWA
jgi:hypothetical protein